MNSNENMVVDGFVSVEQDELVEVNGGWTTADSNLAGNMHGEGGGPVPVRVCRCGGNCRC